MKKILVIEDDEEICLGLKNFLENAGYEVETAADGVAGVNLASRTAFDLLILDIMLPKMDGYAVLEVIRAHSSVPVMMLTALDSEEHQLKGFDLEIDDYLVKPLSMSLLLKRVEVVLRRAQRSQQNSETTILTLGGVSINRDSCEVFEGAKKIALTSKEYDILLVLMGTPHCVFSREVILDTCWGADYFGNDHLVSVHMANLRQKIGEKYIETVRGKGYKFVY